MELQIDEPFPCNDDPIPFIDNDISSIITEPITKSVNSVSYSELRCSNYRNHISHVLHFIHETAGNSNASDEYISICNIIELDILRNMPFSPILKKLIPGTKGFRHFVPKWSYYKSLVLLKKGANLEEFFHQFFVLFHKI